MQLTSKRIGASLAAAACSLLGTVPDAVRAEEPASNDWTLDSALLYYGENQGRVKDGSALFSLAHTVNEDRKFELGLTLDTLTGASPTGAVTSDRVQTFTRPSGRGSYNVAPGATPLDNTFHDTRLGVSGNYTMAVGAASRLQGGLDASVEYDYKHVGANMRFESDFNQKNTTFFGAAAFGEDSINPVGGVPVAFSAMRPAGVTPNRSGSTKSKQVVDVLLGGSQILTRRALLNVALSYGDASGYLTDPYKLLSVVDPVTGAPVASPTDSSIGYYRYEKRPDHRSKESLFTEFRYALDRDSLAVNYRFMTDDWGVHSHTIEGRYHWNLSAQSSLEPQLRYYTQSAARFYRTLLVSGEPLPDYVSADSRLAKLNSWTLGTKYVWRSGNGPEYSIRAEYYKQRADSSPGSRIGVLDSYNLVPSLSAVVVQVGVKLAF